MLNGLGAKYIYPLLFWLLKRHYDIMRLEHIHILDESEWDVMSTSLFTVFKAIAERAGNLEGIYVCIHLYC
jgi:hypothetical protein